jgi:DNA-binding beta-propeller fold protein YncE
VEIDARALRVTRRWSTAPCRQPVSHGHRHEASSALQWMPERRDGRVRLRSWKVIATLPIGTGVDGAAYDPATGDAFASNADGTLTVIPQDSPNAYHVVETVQTSPGSRNMGLDPTTHRLYLPGAKFGPVPAQATPENPRRRAPMLPGSFVLMVVERGAR